MAFARPGITATDSQPTRIRDRLVGLVGVIFVYAAIAYIMLHGSRAAIGRHVDAALKTFVVTLPPPINFKARTNPHRARRSGAASAPNLKAKATPVVAPVPPIPVAPPPRVVVAATPSVGAAIMTGAAAIAGPGTGAGGRGNGTGSGADGDGDGDGGTDLRLLSGRVKDSDYPRAALEARIGGTVGLRFVVGIQGRVTDCVVTRSSGSAILDDATCPLLRKRLRYRPSTDASGRPVPTDVTGEHVWNINRTTEDAEDE